MKKLILFFSILMIYSGQSVAQVGYVSVDDEIYSFLDRMNTIGVITNYNSFELPKRRNQIKTHIIEILQKVENLDQIDRNKLSDFLTEFEVDLISTLEKSESLFPKTNFRYLFNEKEKYLYSHVDSDGNSFFVSFVGKLDYLGKSYPDLDVNQNALLYRFGGEIRGTIFNNLGFEINTTNGSFSGNKDLAQSYSSLRYNYKFLQNNSDNTGDNYFDETSAFLTYENSFAKLKIGNDRKLIGHGNTKVLLSNNAPRMDYVSLDLKYKILEFSFFHGELLGNQFVVTDPIQGSQNIVSDKYLAYHRFGLNFSKHLNVGLGEIIVYANRNVDFSYLNPFNFYKSAEHANQDRDNTFLFFDLQNNTFDKLKIYSTILIDDIDFGKLGKGWYGNQSLISIGAYSNQLYNIIPVDIELQYVKIDPYVFTHRIYDNNFTNSNYSLGTTLQPNSSSVILDFYIRPHHRININLGFLYSIHGSNVIDQNGSLITNYGGDILSGHRPSDSEEVYFLEGQKEIMRNINLGIDIEPIKNWIFSINMDYLNNSLARSQHSENLSTTFSLYTKL